MATVGDRESEKQPEPRFEFVRAEPRLDNQVGIAAGERQHKLSVPLKRINKRLTEVQAGVEAGVRNLAARLAELRSQTEERAAEQAAGLAGLASQLAALEQLGREQRVVVGEFSAGARPALDRLDSWAAAWRVEARQLLERVLEQGSYHSQAANQDHQQLEASMLQAADRCSAAKTGATIIASRDVDEIEEKTEVKGKQAYAEEEMLEDQSLSDEPADTAPGGCQDANLVESGVSRVARVGPQRRNEAGRDWNLRFCEQKAAGGGWTVIHRRGEEPRMRPCLLDRIKLYVDVKQSAFICPQLDYISEPLKPLKLIVMR